MIVAGLHTLIFTTTSIHKLIRASLLCSVSSGNGRLLFLLSGLTHSSGTRDTLVQYTLPYALRPSVSLGTDTCWENQSISGWMEEERQGQINVQILINAAMQGDYTPSELIHSLSRSLPVKRLGIEMNCWVRFAGVFVCVDDKRDTVACWQILQIEQGGRG